MTDPAPRRNPPLERWLEAGIFGSRWLMAPFYVGLAAALAVLLVTFVRELVHEVPQLLWGGGTGEDAIMLTLSLVDLSLAGNLLLIVIFSGYESYVSKLDTFGHEDRPDWIGKVDFSGLKLRLVASIVAISAITLLKAFMRLGEGEINQTQLFWQVTIHLTFVVSGAILAIMDWLAS
ncbi:MAG TPA: TIGR00645 family protein, partial [Caulobacteraceae bacterium]|nr:TIGR00645 family protein [Caulobacteraceae bacterium]